MDFSYQDERFADLQLLRYRLNGFEQLTPQQKALVFYLSEATLWGRDITFDQFGKYNLRIRKMLEVVYCDATISRETDDFKAMEVYLKRVWFSNGIYHHYGCEKFKPDFSSVWLRTQLHLVDVRSLPLEEGETVDAFCDAISSDTPPSFGLNSTLVKSADGSIREEVWSANGKYANALLHIIYWLEKALTVAENEQQKKAISLLINYYRTGDLQTFNQYCIEWLQEHDGTVDFINGFIEVYGDPIGLKGSWEGLVEYIDSEATQRTQTISRNAQWFEDHSPIDPRFRKPVVKGVSANVICAAMLGGDEYPSTAIGINLPNADWIRAQYGSKSITISNITDAYNKASRGNGFKEEFVIDDETLALIEKYGDICDDLHTDLHECLGHGSGQLLPGVDPDALKAYGNTIEEARADLFGLYYMADPKLVELGLLPDGFAYQSQYYTYMMNGLLTQLIRITPGHQIEEAHMRNRALIAHWCQENGDCVHLVSLKGKTYVKITDYPALRQLIAQLLAEIQRIKSEGDFEAARQLVERYAVQVDPAIHAEVLARYERLNLAPYKGFINPVLLPVYDKNSEITDVNVYYGESYAHQMLRYSQSYATLI